MADLAKDTDRDIRLVSMFWGAMSLTGVAALGVYTAMFEPPKAALGEGLFGRLLLWSLGIAMTCATVGFLFGIPKVLQDPRPPGGAPLRPNGTADNSVTAAAQSRPGYAQRVNTNLEEISDWLTKIIVGVGLVKLKQVPPFLNGIADRIQSVSGAAHHSVALAMIAFYGSTGFLFGYLLTRLYLQGALARADHHSVNAEELLAESDRIRSQVRKSTSAGGTQGAPQATAQGAGNAVDQKLRDLAKEYLEVAIEDYGARIYKKDELAIKMYEHAVQAGISRDALAAESDEGLILALATLVHTDPQPGDAERLLQCGSKASRLHVQYRITLAFAELFRKRLATGHRAPVISLLRRYLVRADESLKGVIAATLNLIEGPGAPSGG